MVKFCVPARLVDPRVFPQLWHRGELTPVPTWCADPRSLTGDAKVRSLLSVCFGEVEDLRDQPDGAQDRYELQVHSPRLRIRDEPGNSCGNTGGNTGGNGFIALV